MALARRRDTRTPRGTSARFRMDPARFPLCPAATGRGPWRVYCGYLFRRLRRPPPHPHPSAPAASAATAPRRKRKNEVVGGKSDERQAKRGRREQESPPAAGNNKRKAAGGDSPDPEEVEAEAKRTMADAMILRDVPRPIILRRRSRRDGQPWKCENCGNVNQPSRHLIVHLPAFQCSNCKEPGNATFKFSFANLSCNGVCPIGKMHDQGNTDLCIAYAFTINAEISTRIMYVLSGAARGRDAQLPTFDPLALQQKIISALPPSERHSYSSIRFIETMADVLANEGLFDTTGKALYKASKVERVEEDFATISHALADGYPLTTIIIPGDKFDYPPYGKVYKSRYNLKNIPKGFSVISHNVVLVGASRSETRDTYYYANTYGEEYCMRVSKDKKNKSGGIGKIRTKDICFKPFQFIWVANVGGSKG